MEIFLYRKDSKAVEEGFSEAEIPDLLADAENIVWVDLRGENDEQIAEARRILNDVFHFHCLTIEDCIETRNQPKIEAFSNYLYLIVHGVKPEDTRPDNFVTKELDAYLGANFLVTFHKERFISIKDVKTHVRSSPFAMKRGAAYLLHQVLDQIVDHYMPLVEEFDEVIGSLEERILDPRQNSNRLLGEIMDIRRAVARLKRISTRQLQVLYRLAHGEFPQIPENILPYYRDVHDHLLRIADLSETYRDLVGGLFDIHFAVLSTRTNEVMKTLAIVSAIILPLSLIAGIYGMNFENIPELKSEHGYFITLGVMVILTVVLLWYFWRRGWIFQNSSPALPEDVRSDDKPTLVVAESKASEPLHK